MMDFLKAYSRRRLSSKALLRNQLAQSAAARVVQRTEQSLLFGRGVVEKAVDAARGVVDVRARHDLREVFEGVEAQMVQFVFDLRLRPADGGIDLKEIQPVDSRRTNGVQGLLHEVLLRSGDIDVVDEKDRAIAKIRLVRPRRAFPFMKRAAIDDSVLQTRPAIGVRSV